MNMRTLSGQGLADIERRVIERRVIERRVIRCRLTHETRVYDVSGHVCVCLPRGAVHAPAWRTGWRRPPRRA